MILLVEDENTTRYALANILRDEGYEVMEAGDGLEALSFLGKRHFDLVISDVAMPNLNGFDLLARIRPKWPNLPIIFTSGSVTHGEAEVIVNGSVDFFPKPLDLPNLLATVQRLSSPSPQNWHSRGGVLA
jgi:CheY-like chemotaxis protein